MRPLGHILALALFLCTAVPGMALNVYRVTVDTSAISGQAGNIDFQFIPGAGAQPASVLINGFLSDGALVGTAMNSGDATGQLPGPLTINSLILNKTTGFNDVFQELTFGKSLSFTARFSGAALTPPAGVTGGTTFSFSLYDQAGATPLLTTDPGGAVADINVNPNGSLSTQTFASGPNGRGPVAIITAASPAVPELNPGALAGLGFLLLGFNLARRACARSHSRLRTAP